MYLLRSYTRNEGNSQLLRRTLSESPQTEPLEATDDNGRTIGGQFKAAARGSILYLWTETALYELGTACQFIYNAADSVKSR